MTSFTEMSAAITDYLWNDVERSIESAETLQGASEPFLNRLYREWSSTLALARIFVTCPYRELPEHYREFAADTAERHKVAPDLREDTETLCLIATQGRRRTWNDVERSAGHLAIPLVNRDFVHAVPMVSKLLQDFGVIDDIMSGGVTISEGDSALRTFFVGDATVAQDSQQRFIIPAQGFVKRHGVQSVFGIGGPYAESGQHVLVCIFFTKERLDTRIFDIVSPAFERFMEATTGRVREGQLFD